MNNIFRKLEHFFMNLIIITLIVLISIQLAMKNDLAYQRLKNFEFAIKNVFQGQQAVEVFQRNDIADQGIIVIDLLEDYSLPQVCLVKNGKRVADFSKGIVAVKVKQGDLLALDCKFFTKPLWFRITKISLDIRTWHTGQQFRVSGEEKRLGVVEFYDKL